MSAPTTMVEALQWALHRLELAKLDEGEYYRAADTILAAATADQVDATDAARPPALSDHQRCVIEEMATICNTMRRITAIGDLFASELESGDMLYTAQLGFERVGALADSLVGGAIVGSFGDWMEVRHG